MRSHQDDGSTGPPFLHEYEAAPVGTRMQTTFQMPANTPMDFLKGLQKHCHEEMQYLASFLPKLYTEEARSEQAIHRLCSLLGVDP